MYKKKVPVLGQTKYHSGVVACLRAVTCQQFGKVYKKQAGAEYSLPGCSKSSTALPRTGTVHPFRGAFQR